jgi:hypothetical protein
MTLRGLYDFLTKTWSFGTALEEEEEMQESHTPSSGAELTRLLEQEGFSTRSIDGVMDFGIYLKRHKITVRSKVAFPSRFLIISSST